MCAASIEPHGISSFLAFDVWYDVRSVIARLPAIGALQPKYHSVCACIVVIASEQSVSCDYCQVEIQWNCNPTMRQWEK